ncbi:MAG: hypothetical protein H6R02_544 [Burkholderiaceae bacterium]|nr:hypothetical protein [Burkholderiaceae bacterium]
MTPKVERACVEEALNSRFMSAPAVALSGLNGTALSMEALCAPGPIAVL